MPVALHQFLLDGTPIQGCATPSSSYMEDQDQIDAVLQQGEC